MSDPKGLARLWQQVDENYFRQHFGRKVHIRDAYRTEHASEFAQLGDHASHRRRILLCRVDFEGNWLPDNKVLKIPFLAFSDETIEDTDERLIPIVQELMVEQLKQQGTKVS